MSDETNLLRDSLTAQLDELEKKCAHVELAKEELEKETANLRLRVYGIRTSIVFIAIFIFIEQFKLFILLKQPTVIVIEFAAAEFIQQVAKDKGTRVVVGAISLVEIRHVEDGVLEISGEPAIRSFVSPAPPTSRSMLVRTVTRQTAMS